MQLTLATKNAGKVREIKKILPEFDIQTMTEAGIELDIEENGETILVGNLGFTLQDLWERIPII